MVRAQILRQKLIRLKVLAELVENSEKCEFHILSRTQPQTSDLIILEKFEDGCEISLNINADTSIADVKSQNLNNF